MKYQIGEVVRFSEDASYNGAFGLGGCLATITDAKQYGNYGDGTLAPGPVYKTAITGDKWVHQDYLVPVNGGMKPAGESASDSPLTYQLGEVIRFTNAGKLNGKLATIIAVDHGDPETYQTAITACDEWFVAEAFEPVNGGMKPAEESVFNSIDLCAMSMDELLHLQDEVASAIEIHDQALKEMRRKRILEAIRSVEECVDKDMSHEFAQPFLDVKLKLQYLLDDYNL